MDMSIAEINKKLSELEAELAAKLSDVRAAKLKDARQLVKTFKFTATDLYLNPGGRRARINRSKTAQK